MESKTAEEEISGINPTEVGSMEDFFARIEEAKKEQEEAKKEQEEKAEEKKQEWIKKIREAVSNIQSSLDKATRLRFAETGSQVGGSEAIVVPDVEFPYFTEARAFVQKTENEKSIAREKGVEMIITYEAMGGVLNVIYRKN